MEFSSPLAAMKPPPLPVAWGCSRDISSGRSNLSGAHHMGRFDLNEISMKKPKPDYFTLNPLRGSSPTASLAADLSQNFHIDQSPQFVTPRRSLFSKGLFHRVDSYEGTTTPPFRLEGGTTPPIPSSSPSYGVDAMDVSPLPHKVPFSIVTEIMIESPTPEPIILEDDDLLSPMTIPPNPLLEVPSRPSSVQEKRKPFMPRPSLPRSKNFSTNTITLKNKDSATLPPFQFGSSQFGAAKVSHATLDECFTESPPQERKPPFLAISIPKPRQPFWMSGHNRGAVLSAGPIRKATGPTSRPRSKFRRSLSMFEHPADVMNQDKGEFTPSNLQAVMDIDDSPGLRLPHFVPDEPESLPRITSETLINVLDGKFDSMYEKRMIIDCRFEYEYEGGHVDGAYNFCDKEALAKELFNGETSLSNTLLIFHCEYSAHRAPLMAKFVRQKDRAVNEDHYPHLSYPEVYILQGGYSNFYESHKQRCFPQNYLRMDAKEHEQACEQGMNKLRQRSKLSRAQTFAFGQDYSQIENSPTNQGRSQPAAAYIHSTLSLDQPSTFRHSGARRMASY